MKLFYLITGGAAGTLCRYYLSSALYSVWGNRFPAGTLAVNTAGCLLIGIFYALLQSRAFFPEAILFLFIIGFCGAFTTFSSFVLDNSLLFEAGRFQTAAVYTFSSLVLGFAAFYGGTFLARPFLK